MKLHLKRYEPQRRAALIVGWLYFVFMAYMLLHPMPPTEFIPEFAFSWIHFLAFVALGAFVGLARRRLCVFAWLALLLAWGVGSEFLQRYTGRYFEVGDIIQNVCGVSIGLFSSWALRKYWLEKFLEKDV